MADIQLQHESISQAVAELQKAGNQMQSNMENLLQTLAPLRDHFRGEAAQAFEDFFKVAHNNDQAMSNDIAQAAQTLDSMANHMYHADKAGANSFR
jgi:WXG100 family type VII secretion target